MSADISCWCQQGQRLRWSKLRQRAVSRQDRRCCLADTLICSCPAAFNCNRVSRLSGNPPMIEGWRTSSGLLYLFWRSSCIVPVPQEQWIITPSLRLLHFNHQSWVCLLKTIFLMEISACIRGWESFSFLSMSNNNLKILFVTLITTPIHRRMFYLKMLSLNCSPGVNQVCVQRLQLFVFDNHSAFGHGRGALNLSSS